MLLVDVRDAFYNLLREMVCKAERFESDAAIIDLVRRLGISEDTFSDVCSMLSEDSTVSKFRADSHFESVIAAQVSPSWFAT